MDATAGSYPHQASPAPLQTKGRRRRPKTKPIRFRSIPMPPERAALLDATPPSKYPPLLYPYPPDDGPSAASGVLPLPKRHRGLQQSTQRRTLSPDAPRRSDTPLAYPLPMPACPNPIPSDTSLRPSRTSPSSVPRRRGPADAKPPQDTAVEPVVRPPTSTPTARPSNSNSN